MVGRLLVRKEPHQIIWLVTKAELASIEIFDDTVLRKAAKKLKMWREEGEIDLFIIDKNLIHDIPRAIESGVLNHVSDEYAFQITLARGAKKLPQTSFHPTKKVEATMEISIDADLHTVKSWHFDDFFLNVRYFAKKHELPPPCRGCCEKILSMAKSGTKVNHFPITRQSLMKTNENGFYIGVHEHNGIIVGLSNPRALVSDDARKEFLSFVSTELKKIRQKYRCAINRDDILVSLKKARHNKFGLGIDMPYSFYGGRCAVQEQEEQKKSDDKTLAKNKKESPLKGATKDKSVQHESKLAADADKKHKTSTKESHKTTDKSKSDGHAHKKAPKEEKPQLPVLPQIPDDYPGRGILEIRPAPDKMSASIINFRVPYYDKYKNDFTEQWLDYEMTRLGLVPRQPELLKRIMGNVKTSRDLNELRLVEAEEGTAPSDAYLVETVDLDGDHGADHGEDTEDDDSADVESVNLRRSVVKTVAIGVKIAEWQFKTPGTNGINIFGEPIPPPKPELPEVNLGEGAKEGPDGTFISTKEGLPVVKPSELIIDVQKHYVIGSDVNLTTGDIVFDGAVSVEGNITDNASVTCSGDLHVKKGILVAKIAVGGKVTVTEGIVNSSVSCKGDIVAGFAENSTLTTQGDIHTKRSVMNCNVVVKNIRCTGDPGLVAGGKIYCSNQIIANNIGFPNNAMTYIFMGVNWQHARRVAINHRRIEIFEEFIDEKAKELATFDGKSAAQLTKAHKETMRHLKKLKKRATSILEHLHKRSTHLKVHSEGFNERSEIIVINTCVDNTAIKMGDSLVDMMGDCKSIKINYKKRNDSHIAALPEDYEIAADGSIVDKTKAKSDKKAS